MAKTQRAIGGTLNLVTPDIPSEVNIGTINRSKTEGWFRFGHDNLFPQGLASINRRSPVHRAVLRNKIVYCSGSKIFVKQESETNSALQEFILRANGKNESLRKIHKKLVTDKLSFGNAYLEVVTDEKRNFIAFFHKDATTCRIGKEKFEGSILLHPSWNNIYNSKRKLKRLPIYPRFEKIGGYMRSIVHFKDYEPEFSNYGIPTWVAGMDAAAIAYKTNKWNISRLDNSFAPSGTLILDGNISEPDAKKLKNDFNKTFTGEGNQGKIFFVIKQLGGEGTKFLSFNDAKEGDWLSLQKQSAQDVITSHNWFRSLSGMSEAGQLGNSQQIRTEFEIAKSTIINEEQNSFLEIYSEILTSKMGWKGEDIQIDNAPPTTIADKIIPGDVLSRNEQRAVLGFPAEQQEEIPLALSGIQVQSMADIIQRAASGLLPIGSTKFILKKSFGMTDPETEMALKEISDGTFKITQATPPEKIQPTAQ